MNKCLIMFYTHSVKVHESALIQYAFYHPLHNGSEAEDRQTGVIYEGSSKSFCAFLYTTLVYFQFLERRLELFYFLFHIGRFPSTICSRELTKSQEVSQMFKCSLTFGRCNGCLGDSCKLVDLPQLSIHVRLVTRTEGVRVHFSYQ